MQYHFSHHLEQNVGFVLAVGTSSYITQTVWSLLYAVTSHTALVIFALQKNNVASNMAWLFSQALPPPHFLMLIGPPAFVALFNPKKNVKVLPPQIIADLFSELS